MNSSGKTTSSAPCSAASRRARRTLSPRRVKARMQRPDDAPPAPRCGPRPRSRRGRGGARVPPRRRSVSDQPRARRRRALRRVARRQREAVALVRHGILRVPAIAIVAGELGAVAQVVASRAAEPAHAGRSSRARARRPPSGREPVRRARFRPRCRRSRRPAPAEASGAAARRPARGDRSGRRRTPAPADGSAGPGRGRSSRRGVGGRPSGRAPSHSLRPAQESFSGNSAILHGGVRIVG